MYNVLPACTPVSQKRVPYLITDGCETPCGCWELNSGHLEEQLMLLSAEPFSKYLLLFLPLFQITLFE